MNPAKPQETEGMLEQLTSQKQVSPGVRCLSMCAMAKQGVVEASGALGMYGKRAAIAGVTLNGSVAAARAQNC